MSDLNPKGLEFVIGGAKRHLLFTLNVIDSIQDHYDLPVYDALKMLAEPRKQAKALKYFLTVLLNDEWEREKAKGNKTLLKELTQKEVGWMLDTSNLAPAVSAVIQAYSGSLPKPDEDDDPNQKSEPQKS